MDDLHLAQQLSIENNETEKGSLEAVMLAAMSLISFSFRFVLVFRLLALGRAQIYKFEEMAAPQQYSLQTLYMYYIYSKQESPSPEIDPFVGFNSISSSYTVGSPTDPALDNYKGIQVSIMRYRDFWDLIDPKKFCCTQEDVQNKKCKNVDELLIQKPADARNRDVFVYTHTVTPKKGNYTKRIVRKSGAYLLVLSNCGEIQNIKVSGGVLVKNPYGYLPGIEYYKMPFYACLALVYLGLGACWTLLSLRWWKELFNIQNCIGVVILFGLLDAFMQFVYYRTWNGEGSRSRVLFVVCVVISVSKSVFSYMLVLVASLGWGVTKLELEKSTIMKISCICFVYIVLDAVREVVLSFRHSPSLSLTFVLLCVLPVSTLHGAIFYWVFTALSELIQNLRDSRQTQKLQLFEKLWKVLLFALIVAALTLMVQIFVFAQDIAKQWMYQWLFSDGVAHALFLIVLVVMMYLWAPNENSNRYAYSQQISCDDGPDSEMIEPTTWADEVVKDDPREVERGTVPAGSFGKASLDEDFSI